MTEIKICGMTCEEDIACANEFLPDYVGFVLFFPKSKRNLSLERAAQLRERLSSKVKAVAVVVSPTVEQARKIEEVGFDYIQIHGTLSEEVYEAVSIPILRAFNVTDLDRLPEYAAMEKIVGYVFDSKTPGSGKTFDWSLVTSLKGLVPKSEGNESEENGADRGEKAGGTDKEKEKNLSGNPAKKKIFLAGGIDEENVERAIREVSPDAIDVSSAVERPAVNGYSGGKDPEKMKNLINKIRMVYDEK